VTLSQLKEHRDERAKLPYWVSPIRFSRFCETCRKVNEICPGVLVVDVARTRADRRNATRVEIHFKEINDSAKDGEKIDLPKLIAQRVSAAGKALVEGAAA
jgi:hypothetical protein